MVKNLVILAVVVGLCLPGVATAQGCAPDRLVRMTIRNISPGLAAADPRAQPRTIWRQGAKLLRSEESPDLATGGATMVVIISEPDIWTFNLSSRRGGHALDPGPVLEVQAPVLPPSPDLPADFRTLEFGCEAAFVAAHAPQPARNVPWGKTVLAAHMATVGEHSIAFLMDSRRSAPVLISYARAGAPIFAIRYDAYRADLPEQPDLFLPPKNVQITETPGASGPVTSAFRPD